MAAGEHLSRDAPIPDTGDLHDDLQELVGGLAEVFTRPATRRLVAALVAGMADDEQLAAAVRDGFLGARRRAARAVLGQGAARGENRHDVDLDVAIDLLAAPFYHRLLITGQAIDDRYGQQVVDAVLTWIRTSWRPQHPPQSARVRTAYDGRSVVTAGCLGHRHPCMGSSRPGAHVFIDLDTA